MSRIKKPVSESIDYSNYDSYYGLLKMMFDHIRNDSDDDLSRVNPPRDFSRERGLIVLNLLTQAQG